ncbi:hypothetical protein ATANTOWER_028407 [Ataeniobius toweri]|uniref:Uncharacterized protein n=1 Tax=Ataeniobius toweri TaxID=208326 RepID=A0ABU7A9W6_9TELE|nr:hypothetical protein [Ataeniobius toweri]
MWLRLGGGAGQPARCGKVCRAGGWVAGILGHLQGLRVGLAGCPVLGVLWWPFSNASFCGSCPCPGAGPQLPVGWVGRYVPALGRLVGCAWPARPGYPAGACFPLMD